MSLNHLLFWRCPGCAGTGLVPWTDKQGATFSKLRPCGGCEGTGLRGWLFNIALWWWRI